MVVSGKIRYKHHQIDFEVKFEHEDIVAGEIKSDDAKQQLIKAINRKFRVMYPFESEIDSIHVRSI